MALTGCSEAESHGEAASASPSASNSNASRTPQGVAVGSAQSGSDAASPSASASGSVPPTRPKLPDEDRIDATLEAQRASMLNRMRVMLGATDAQLDAVRAVLGRNTIVGQGNPEVTEHPMTRAECRARREAAAVVDEDDPRCGGAFMAPVWDPTSGQTKADATLCVDRYEFPGIPCEYPVTWASPKDAADLCGALGKRICDAHEWEGSCAGAVLPIEREYAFGKPRKEAKNRHNANRQLVWAYGAEKHHERCATGSKKSKTCSKSGWKRCGSNTYPAGAFPECKSPFGVFDLHGNVAEHMNLPLKASELASRGGTGETEMKGSWFIFAEYEAHVDDCRWRAPDWHVTRLTSPDGHANYHLGFRCCKDIGDDTAKP